MWRFSFGFHRISCLLFLAASAANADDWPNWRGPHGDGISREPGQSCIGVGSKDGKLLWRFDWKTMFDINAATPIYSEGYLFLSSN